MIAFIADSSFDMPNVKTKYPIFFAPLRVIIDGKEFVDKVNLTVDQFYKMLKDAKDFSTSLPNPKEAEELIKKLYDEYDKIYMLSLSSKLSGTFNMFQMVSQNFKDKVKVLDLKTASIESYAIFRKLVEYVEKDIELTQDIVDKIRKNLKMYFAVMDLKYLEKGGRIGKAKALLGKMLKIKPILSVDETGAVESIAMERKLSSLVNKLIELGESFLKEHKISDPYFLAAYGSKEYKKYIDKLVQHFNIKDITQISAAVGIHTGPEVFGFVVSS